MRSSSTCWQSYWDGIICERVIYLCVLTQQCEGVLDLSVVCIDLVAMMCEYIVGQYMYVRSYVRKCYVLTVVVSSECEGQRFRILGSYSSRCN